ncbi:hypothetical protein P154DRAFT_422717 [Amniculicola lignicola CBS 123094]|uniref:Tat pathway signal sequence n=1 Tax=Amniculicola lignicola CBS 123094 TaxID=1392246 RepID=A0A6A5WYC0_9PLEO|nr:hypothetical protein P154DRAFT_422717 [Amniculicola lignicola CBS 123094]
MFEKFLRRPSKFTQIPQQEDSESLLSPASSLTLSTQHVRTWERHPGVKFVFASVVFLTTFNLVQILWVGLQFHRGQFVTDADGFCMNHISKYSPVVRDVEPDWHTVQFNGSFLKQNIYRQPAGPEVDAAWSALGIDYRSVVIPESEAKRTGLRPDQVKINQKYGGGYPANVEGLHHLHCLNLLRKALYWNYDYYRKQKEGAFVNAEFIVQIHTTHCLDILRQQLMCVTDVGVLGQVWWQPEGDDKPTQFVDFNTKHRCRNYEAIRAWAEAHQLPPESEVDMNHFYEMPKPGDTILPEIP